MSVTPLTTDEFNGLAKAREVDYRPLTPDEIKLLGLTDLEILQLTDHPAYAESAHRRLRSMFETSKPPAPRDPAPKAAELDARIWQIVNQAVLTKEERKREYATLLCVVGKSLRESNDASNQRIEALEKSVPAADALSGYEARIARLEDRIGGFASADKVASLVDQIRELRSEKDRLQQQLSANQKHCQNLEKKLGGIIGNK